MCFLILVFKLPSTAAAAAAHFKEKVSSDVRTTQAPPGEAELTHHTHSKKPVFTMVMCYLETSIVLVYIVNLVTADQQRNIR